MPKNYDGLINVPPPPGPLKKASFPFFGKMSSGAKVSAAILFFSSRSSSRLPPGQTPVFLRSRIIREKEASGIFVPSFGRPEVEEKITSDGKKWGSIL